MGKSTFDRPKMVDLGVEWQPLGLRRCGHPALLPGLVRTTESFFRAVKVMKSNEKSRNKKVLQGGAPVR